MEPWIYIVPIALAASTVAGVAGTGGGVLLLPALTALLGVREAIPLYALAQLIGNLSRVGFNRRELDLQVVRWFSLGAVPAAVLGAWLFTRLPDAHLLRLLGAFLLVSVAWRWSRRKAKPGLSAPWFGPIGAVFAVISGLAGSAGPFLAPFYLSYGLVKGAYIGTEALGTAIMHVVKLASYQGLGAMNSTIWLRGLLLGPAMFFGSYLGKRLLDRMSITAFVRAIDVVIAGFGLWFVLK